MVWNDIETTNRDALTDLQDQRLRKQVSSVYENVPFYREQFDEAGISPSDVDGVEDLSRLPFTTKEDLRDHYPEGLFAVGDDELRCLHASSGTTGKPKVVGYTRKDLDTWREVMARSLTAAGVTEGSRVQNAYGYGLFTGGLGVHHGCDELGATVIPIGGGQTKRQLEFLADLGSETLTCTPSYALYLAEQADEMGIDLRSLPLSTVIFGAEPCTDPMREAIEERLDVTGVDIYGLSEVIGPGVSIECAEAQDGLHVWEDHFYPEVIDPETGDVLPDGEEGELVFTTLTKQGMPVVRYRTGDMTTLTRGECDCGRTTVRMDNVTGRTDDLLIVRGVNLYPSEIEATVLEIEGLAPQYRIDLYRENELDEIHITLEESPTYGGDATDLREEARSRLDAQLSFSPDEVDVREPGGIERQETGKVQRVWDHR
ncbi:phenylacetate--CoA ligase PaaK [Halomarina oriensis]|uniref:AMP-binding protein n=1 Tax=Halomarina oriensis TaxID=671145 RepID=A0A6B0GLV8_9EURY|nr:phenylacetate--CoA ligase PaaK [Halomarina oriensis]MWG34687.1 AMP-binding protein [Halomarina oriensis]